MKLQRQMRASITVEATLIMPIFMFALVAFLFFFQIFRLQENIQESITRVSKLASQYGYVYEYLQNSARANEEDNGGSEPAKEEGDKKKEQSMAKQAIGGCFDGTMFRTKFLEYMGKDQNDRCIIGGLQGISFLESSFMKQDSKDIEVVAVYKVKIPVLFFNIWPFTVVQRVHSRGFVGQSLLEDADCGEGEESKDKDEYVYVTRTGSKYHTNYNCTYLNPKVSSISGKDISGKRNSGGAKYYPCEACMKGKCSENGTYYITQYGTRYHSSSSCKKIERDIKRIKKSQIGGRTPCSKCGR